jgi:hypothetical protein
VKRSLCMALLPVFGGGCAIRIRITDEATG